MASCGTPSACRFMTTRRSTGMALIFGRVTGSGAKIGQPKTALTTLRQAIKRVFLIIFPRE